MTTLIILAASLVLSLVLTPVVRGLAFRLQLVDHPDGRRKMHGRIIPLGGGIAILISASLALGLTLLMSGNVSASEPGQRLLGLFLASLFICLLGVADDYRWLRGRHKLMGQVLAVVIVIQSGVLVRTLSLFGYRLELGIFAFPFTMFWLLGAINSLNLLDGMDGLLGTVATFIGAGLCVLGVLNGNMDAAWVAAALVGGVLGFLRYNFPPATVFLGDAGSMLIGLVLGTLCLQGPANAPDLMVLAIPMAMFTIPIIDTGAAVLRRKLTGRSLYTTDRGHLHHCLLRAGFTTRQVLFAVGCFSVVAVGSALAAVVWHYEIIALAGSATVIVTLMITRLFGNAESVLLGKRVLGVISSPFRRGKHERGHLLEVRLQGSAEWNELWQMLLAWARDLQMRSVRLDINAPAFHESYHANWECANKDREGIHGWHIEVPLKAHGHVVGRLAVAGFLSWPQGGSKAMVAVATFLEDVEHAIPLLIGNQVGRLEGDKRSQNVAPRNDVPAATGALMTDLNGIANY